MNNLSEWQDTIVAIATAPGVGAIAVIRLSGKDSIGIANKLFVSKDIAKAKTHTLHYGILQNEGETIDEVLLTVFRGPKSYTGEDTVEISCHGSRFVQQEILKACISSGARLAKPGEFTQRAFLNGKLDLAQAESVADLIAADTKAAQQTALNHLRGGFSNDLESLREKLINFAALIELELDFSDEDVEFADREEFRKLIDVLKAKTASLLHSFALGNVIKNGVKVAIIGKPNVGKSTLLNALLNEERAIVSNIAGTTRDSIEETLNINGILFRLIDTAGIRRHSTDVIEAIGMERSKANAAKADIVLVVKDMLDNSDENNEASTNLWLKDFESKTMIVQNKYNKWLKENGKLENLPGENQQFIDAKEGFGIEQLKEALYKKTMDSHNATEGTIVTNARHYEALQNMYTSLLAIEEGMQKKLTGDLLTIDIRRALHYLGIITGKVEIDKDVLGAVFSKFCIGK